MVLPGQRQTQIAWFDQSDVGKGDIGRIYCVFCNASILKRSAYQLEVVECSGSIWLDDTDFANHVRDTMLQHLT